MSSSYITDDEGNIAYPKTLAKCVNKGGSTLEEYLNDVEEATLIKPTVSGTDMVLTDSSDMNIQELHLYGKTEQKTTKGIQLLNLRNSLGGTRGGITYTPNGDGSFKREGTATSASGNAWLLGNYITEITDKDVLMILEAGKQYFVKDCAVFMGTTLIAGGESKIINVLESKYPEGIKVTGIRNPGVVLNRTYNDIIYPIIAESSTAIEWEEYTGGIASPNPDYPQGMNCVENPAISVAGKNLLTNNAKSKQIRNLIYTVNEDKSISVKGTYEVGKDVTESDIYLFGTFNDEGQYVYIPKGRYSINTISVPNGTYIAREKTKGSIIKSENIIKTLSEQDCYFYSWVFRITKDGTYNSTLYPQMEVGNTATEYESYKEIQSAQQTCELNGIGDVKDELIIRADGTGQLIQRIKLYDCSQIPNDKSIVTNPDNTYYLFSVDKYNTNATRVISTHFTSKMFDKTWGNAFKVNGNIYFGRKGIPESITDADAMKQWLIGNKVKILFQLIEPVVTELSAEEVQKILAIHTNKPNSTIWNDQNADMQITYVADAKNYIDSKLTELENSVCGGLLITDNLIDNSNMLNNTALTISDKISTSSNSTYKTYLNIPVKAGESYYIGKSHRNSCIIDSIENKKVLQSNMVNQTDSYIFNVNYDGFLCVCFYATEQNPKIALLTREKTES